MGAVSGSLAGSSTTAWTAGIAAERRLGSALALGGEIVINNRGASLRGSELATSDLVFTSGYKVSLSTVGVAPIARYYIRGKPGSFRPVLSSGVLLWQSIGCSVDYHSELDTGVLTDGCDGFDPGLSGSAPLKRLKQSNGTTLLLGLGLNNGRIGMETRAERVLGDGAQTASGRFRFGNTLSLVVRVHPGR